ncbi:hypothetical protein KKH23_06460, partial [Patescibacteria group bacterium]|nr:hypothetical protein [Patescibacteria group bacterium]
ELIDKNIICLGNYREGYNKVNVNMKLFSELYKSEYQDDNGWLLPYHVYGGCAGTGFTFLIDRLVYPGLYILAWTDSNTQSHQIEYRTLPSDDLASVQAALISLINAEGFLSTNLGGNLISLCGDTYYDPRIDPTSVDLSWVYLITRNIGKESFKFGANHEFGVVYSDRADRIGSVNRGDDTVLYIPFYTEDESSIKGQVVDGNYGNIVKYEINHIPPEWAIHYQIVYSGNTTVDYFLQIRIYSAGSIIVGVEYVEIDVNTTITELVSLNSSTIVQSYVWEKGDRIRFICNKLGVPKTDYKYFNEYVDLEILSQDELTGKIKVSSDFNINIPESGGTVVEIYRPKKSLPDDSNSRIFYEIGECYPILNPHTANRFHSAGYDNDGEGYAQDQSASQPAKGTLMAGDTYTKQRNIKADTAIPAEDYNYNEFYQSNSWNRGRIGIVDENMESRQFKAHLRHGGRYFDNTGINDLAVFKYDDYTSLSETWGGIVRTIMSGFTLKVYQNYKATSIYIGRISYVDAKGKEYLQRSDDIFGTEIPSEDNYGSYHPESFVKSGRHIYFFDIYSGKIIRDATNGMIPISDYGIRDWTKDKAQELLAGYSEINVYGGFNKKYEELYLTFVAINNSTKLYEGWTLLFHEPSNKWKSFVNFEKTVSGIVNYPDYYGSLGNTFCLFLNGEFYLQDSNSLYGYFFGEQKSMVLNIPINKNHPQVKGFLSMVLNSNKASEIEITIPSSDVYPHGMYSVIKKAKFINKEGVWYAEFDKDMYTTTDIPPAIPHAGLSDLINGRTLKGQVATIKVTFDDSDYVYLSNIIVNSFASQLSGV